MQTSAFTKLLKKYEKTEIFTNLHIKILTLSIKIITNQNKSKNLYSKTMKKLYVRECKSKAIT
jgi:hypothetical protein